jgi:hypothetical protein
MSSIQYFRRDVEIPAFTENDSRDLVEWGKDNLLPQWLNYLYYTCAVHQGIINGKVMFTVGGGLQGSDELIRLFEPHLKKIDLDLEISNSFYLKCFLDFNEDRIKKIQFIPFEWVRVKKDGNFVISEDWSDNRVPKREYVSFENLEDERVFILSFKEDGKQFKIDGGKKLTLNYYPSIPYSGAIKSIMTDIEITNYEFSEVCNNFSIGSVLSLNNGANPNEEDRQRTKDYILDNATGSDNAGGVAIVFNNGKDTEPSVLHLNGNQLHERYLSLDESVQNKILKGHSVISGELFGFTKDGNFNQSNLDLAYFFMKENYFKVRQNQILSLIEKVAEYNGVAMDVEFIEFELPSIAPQPTQPQFKLKKEEDKDKYIIEAFANCGRERDGNEDVVLFGKYDEVLIKNNFAELTQIQQNVLGLISEGNLFDGIYKSLEINPADLSRVYSELNKKGLIEKNGKLTSQGKIQIINQDASRLRIEYTYEVKPRYGEKVIPSTRPFCRELIRLNRSYSIEDINTISAQFEMDVWRYRGGWFHNPETNNNEPSCRHFWQQNIIFV